MAGFFDTLASYVSTLLIIPLIGTGVYLTWRLKLVQLFHFRHSWRVIAGIYDNPEDEGDINHLQALSAALSATIGIGNIAGVATAIHFGGPGALFWMWVTAFVGMATKFSEATLAMVFRKIHKDGSASGGPMYYIEMGLGKKWKPLAVFFASAVIISSFGQGNSIQAFTVADSFRAEFGISPVLTGIVLTTAVGLVIIGGIRRIGVVASRLVPFMAFAYIVGALIVVGRHATEIPAAFVTIFENAFTAHGAIGGFAGSSFFLALLWGVRRGIYSNESGQGSAPIAHAAAKTDEPVREGTVAMVGPFIDTLLICTLTGLCILLTGVWHEKFPDKMDIANITAVHPSGALEAGGKIAEEDRLSGDFILKNGVLEETSIYFNNSMVESPLFFTHIEKTPIEDAIVRIKDGTIIEFTTVTGKEPAETAYLEGNALRNGSPLTAMAFEVGLGGKWGSYVVTFGVLFFALSTVISWSYYGDRASLYLFGPSGIRIYRWIYVAVVFIGSNLALATVWGFGDVAISLMAIPNLIALFFLAPKIKELKEEYFSREHKPFRS